jgi:hypothetical protein
MLKTIHNDSDNLNRRGSIEVLDIVVWSVGGRRRSVR